MPRAGVDSLLSLRERLRTFRGAKGDCGEIACQIESRLRRHVENEHGPDEAVIDFRLLIAIGAAVRRRLAS